MVDSGIKTTFYVYERGENMVCKNITDALIEDVIEITWMFDELIENGSIKSWDDIVDQECGSDGIKNTIKDIALKFEEKYPFDASREDYNDYIDTICMFAESKLIEKYKKGN